MKKCQICKQDQQTTFTAPFVLDSQMEITVCYSCWDGIVHVVVKFLEFQGVIDMSQIITEDDLRKEE